MLILFFEDLLQMTGVHVIQVLTIFTKRGYLQNVNVSNMRNYLSLLYFFRIGSKRICALIFFLFVFQKLFLLLCVSFVFVSFFSVLYFSGTFFSGGERGIREVLRSLIIVTASAKKSNR